MKRVGAIYSRDTSKSKEKVTKLPLQNINQNIRRNQQNKTKPQKKWRVDMDNELQSESRSSFNDINHDYFETDCRAVSFSQSKHEEKYCQSQHNFQKHAKEDADVVSKLNCLNNILKEIATLKTCGLKGSQNKKLGEVEDRLLGYQRKLLQISKQNQK